MAITYGFFNSKNGDRKYNADDIGKYFDKLITSGVYANPSSNLQVIEATGMTVNVSPGRAMLDCHWLNNDANYLLQIESADVILDRIDAVVMKLDLNDSVRNISIVVKKGVASSNPVAPAMIRNDFIKEWCLAEIKVNKLATKITQSDIRDTRADTTVCGWVTGLIEQVDTSTLLLQWEDMYNKYYANMKAEFEKWFSALTQQLGIITYIQKYQNVYTPQSEVREVQINIPEYERLNDILQVYIGGIMLIEGKEYEVRGTGSSAVIVLTNTIRPGNDLTFIVLKSVIGTKPLLA